MNEKNEMWHIHTIKYDSALKKEGNSDTYYNMDEPQWHYAKLVTKEQILYNSTYVRYLE